MIREAIVVRSLAESDMGLFTAHRPTTTSKQRAIGVTTAAAEILLDPGLFDRDGGDFDCICVFDGYAKRELRPICKVGKNWRLGGDQLQGRMFKALDAKDFALIRSRRANDGSTPVLITFVARASQQMVQAGLSATVQDRLHQSVVVFTDDAPEFAALARLFPPVPADLLVGPPPVRSARRGKGKVD